MHGRASDEDGAPIEGADLQARLAGSGGPLLLDGATGTELERAGLPTGLPLWSTHALIERPAAVREIHAAYLRSGAEIVTANTFRTQRRTLVRAGLPEDADRRLTRLAVGLAHEAVRAEAGERRCWVAGSLPPLEDCYFPERVPDATTLAREHGIHAGCLREAGVDLILVETMGTRRETEAASRAACDTGLPFLVGLVSWEPGRLLSGESLVDAARGAVDLGAAAVGVNCVPISSLEPSRRALTSARLPLLVSPNLGEPNDTTGFSRGEALEPTFFAEALAPWLAEPELRVVGGCCGTTPAHVAALAHALR